MSIDVRAETMVARPRSAVASYVVDPANDRKWIGGIVEAEMLTAPPVSKGTKVRRVAKFLGRRMEYTPEVVEYEPDAVLAMHAGAPFPMDIRYEFQDVDGGTMVAVRVHGEGSGFFKLAEPLLGAAVRRNVSKDLATLRRLLESDGAGA